MRSFMSRIQKVSSYLLAIFNFLLIVLPLFSLSIWLFMDVEPIKSLIAEGLLFSPVETPEGTINISTIKWTHLSKFTSFMWYFSDCYFMDHGGRVQASRRTKIDHLSGG